MPYLDKAKQKAYNAKRRLDPAYRAQFNEWRKQYRKLHPEKLRAENAKYRTPEKVKEYSRRDRMKHQPKRTAQHREYVKKNHVRVRIYNRNRFLLKRFGITFEQLEEMYVKQNGRCAICNLEFVHRRQLHVDHDHTTGVVREILCNKCNPGLGFWNDDIELMEKAIAYIRKWKTI